MVRDRGALALTAVCALLAVSMVGAPAWASGANKPGPVAGRVTADFNGDSPGIPNPPVAGDEFGWWQA